MTDSPYDKDVRAFAAALLQGTVELFRLPGSEPRDWIADQAIAMADELERRRKGRAAADAQAAALRASAFSGQQGPFPAGLVRVHNRSHL